MPDENGTETIRSDAQSVHDVLFGDTAEEPAAAVAEDAGSTENDAKDANGDAEQDAADAGDKAEAEDKVNAAETDAQDDLKVVVVIKGDRATIGVKGTVGPPHRVLRRDGPVRAGAGDSGSGGEGQGQVGGGS